MPSNKKSFGNFGSFGPKLSSTSLIHPFKPENDEDQYYRLSRLTKDLKITAGVWDQAQKLIANGIITNLNVEAGFYHLDGRSSTVQAISCTVDRKDSPLVTELFATKDRIFTLICRDYACTRLRNYEDNFPRYGTYSQIRRVCPHEAALLILVDDCLKRNRIGDETSYAASELLSEFLIESQAASPDSSDLGTVLLTPRFVKENNRLLLGFKTGLQNGPKAKQFVIRSLSQFVDTVMDKGVWETGKTAPDIDFSSNSFDTASQVFFDLLLQEHRSLTWYANQLNQSFGYYASHHSAGLGTFFEPRGGVLDRLFDLLKDQEAAFSNKDNSLAPSTLAFEEGTLNASLTLEPVKRKNKIVGARLHGDLPSLLQGEKANYLLTDDSLKRIDAGSSKAVSRLQEWTEEGELDITIGLTSMGSFYHYMLPELRKTIRINETDADVLAEITPPAPVFSFYLDLDASRPVMEAKVAYQDQVFRLNPKENTAPSEAFRDAYKERSIRKAIARYFPEADKSGRLFTCAEDQDSIYAVFESGVSMLLSLGEVHSTDRFDAVRIRRKSPLSVGVSLSHGMLELKIESEDLSKEELISLLNSYARKKKYHRLKNGDFVMLQEGQELFSDLMGSMHLSPEQLAEGSVSLPAYRTLYMDQLAEESKQIQIYRDKRFRQLTKDFKTINEADYDPPRSLESILRPYQVYGFQWLRTIEAYGFGGILADDMGLGKTLQVIALLLSRKEKGLPGPSLIVCPASLVYNWQEEIKRFAPSLQSLLVLGTQKERENQLHKLLSAMQGHIQTALPSTASGEAMQNQPDAFLPDVLITSYDLLKRDIELYKDLSFHYEVIDEAQYIKTQTTAAARACKKIKAHTRFALTGTPIENRLSELWSIFDYLMPGFLYAYPSFKGDFESPIVKKDDEKAKLRLKQMVSPFILRRLKKDVLKELPDKLEETRYAKMEKDQRLLYDAQVAHMQEMLAKTSKEELNKNRFQVLAELTRIRQICCDPSLFLEDYKGSSAKREACLDLIQSAIECEHRILLFSQFTSMLSLLAGDLTNAGIEYYTITGSTPKKERLELVDAFNQGDVPVFLISLKAGGTGLNLTGADVVIHYDPWWNLAAQNQATDRAHRIGQTHTVTVYSMIAAGSVEEKIQNLQQTKKELAEEILSGEMGSLSQLSKEDLLDLLS